MELILIRHAQPLPEATEGTGDQRPTNPGLDDTGFEQSHSVARWLAKAPLHRVVSSPAMRAIQTAEATATRLGLDIEIDERLRDARPVAARYVPIEEEKSRDPEAYRVRLLQYRENAEMDAAYERVNAGLDDWTGRHPGERIAAFCHGSVVNLFAARVLGLPKKAFLDAAYASGHRFMISRAGIRSVMSLNETSYL